MQNYTINVSLNKTIIDSIKYKIKNEGYNNVSEYIRDCLRTSLGIVKQHKKDDEYIYDSDGFQYSKRVLNTLSEEAEKDYKAGKLKSIKSLKESV
jgi:Arc/MetJ-type ribon-helix-helix transcriptional regulator